MENGGRSHGGNSGQTIMNKQKSITSFFKRKEPESNTVPNNKDIAPNTEDTRPKGAQIEEGPSKLRKIELNSVDINSLEREPGLRPSIWDYPVEKRNEIRRCYIKLGPYQPQLSNYPASESAHRRRFQASWFKKFPDWLEYSTSKNAACCLPCFLFAPPNAREKTYTVTGYKNWKKVNDGKRCAFLTHVGQGPNTIQKNAVHSYRTLPKQKEQLRNVFNKQSERQIKQNRLRLKAYIDILRLLTMQSCALRGHDESNKSENQGNYLEFRKLLALYNKDVSKAIRQAPYNAKYIAPSIQKEILHIICNKVRNSIRQDIGDSKFCIIVDEARDESKREQMGLVLRFIDRNGSIRERFFDLIHVPDTSAATLKKELCSVLTRHNLAVEDIRGQDYDGASNMRGELESGRGANQMSSLKRAGDTRWGSHLYSIRSVLKMYDAIISVLKVMMDDKSCPSSVRGDADTALNLMISFNFVFIPHLMVEILEIGDVLSQALQQKSQDIVNAMGLVSTSRKLLFKMREDGWKNFKESVELFCQQRDIIVPDMHAPYIARRGRARQQHDTITMDHFYRVDIFLGTIDKQLHELNHRFNDKALELLSLSSLIEPKNGFKNFDVEKICMLAEKHYPMDFTEQERNNLKYQLEHFITGAKEDPNFMNLSTLEDVCKQLATTEKSKVFSLFDRLIRLILTLPVSTATTERAFSAMKIMKTRLRNKMEDEFLADSLVIYIERIIAKTFSTKSIIDDFKLLKERRALL